MIISGFLFYIFLLIATAFAEFGVIFNGRSGTKPGWAFQGKLFKNSTNAYISPELKAIPVAGNSKSMTICGYTVHHDTVSYFPFVVLLLDQKSGYAEIKLKSNVERDILKSSYTFQIEAYDCDVIPHYSERKFVVIELKTTQRPLFTSSSYHFSANVHTAVGTKIGSVTAYERPKRISLDSISEGICKYVIVSPSPVPFSIDKLGSIITKVLVLDNVKSVRYRFIVRATDCKQPTPITSIVPVTVDVFDDCEPHWTGLPSSVEYKSGKSVLPIMVTNSLVPSLHLCSMKCQDLLAVVKVKLQGEDMNVANTKSCKRDYASLTKQEKLCDVSPNGIDVLSVAGAHLRDGSDGGYFFKGRNYVPIDDRYNKFGHGYTRQFTVMFWMRHGGMEPGAPKEQILCNSDGQEHNRHHMSLFLHNCKLILLFRKEFWEGDQTSYTPSEWRYGPMKEVCDNEWHHYAVRFHDGSVSVQIDGEMSIKGSQYLDDMPLKKSLSRNNLTTTFTVAACFHSKTGTYVQFFQGHLASLKILDGELEKKNNIRCVATCGEALLVSHVMEVIDGQSSVTVSSDSITLRSNDLFNLLRMVSGLSYINTEVNNESIRTVTITTEIRCNSRQVSSVPQRSITIQLRSSSYKRPQDRPIIDISSRINVSGDYNERVALFPDIKFLKHEGAPDSVQSCIVRPVGPDLQHWEYIDWPQTLIIDFHLSTFNSSKGLFIDGTLLLRHYETILRNVYYISKKTDSNGSGRRQFAISCTIIDDMITEKMVINVYMKPRDLKTYYIVDDPIQDHKTLDNFGKIEAQLNQNEKEDIKEKESRKQSLPTTAVWIVLSCLVLVVVGAAVALVIFRRKFKNRPKMFLNDLYERRRDRLTVTTNPMITEVETVIDDEDDVPEEEDEFDDDDYVEEDINNSSAKTRISIPMFVAVHGAAVDV